MKFCVPPPQTRLQDGQVQMESGRTDLHHFTARTTRRTTSGGNSSQDQVGGSQNCIPSTCAQVRVRASHAHRHWKCLTQQMIATKPWKCVATFLRVQFLSQPSRPVGPPAPSALLSSSTSLSTRLVEAVVVTGETQPPHNRTRFLHLLQSPAVHALVSRHVLRSWKRSGFHLTPVAAWRTANWEHMLQPSSPLIVFAVCLTCADWNSLQFHFWLQRMRIQSHSGYDAFHHNKTQPAEALKTLEM